MTFIVVTSEKLDQSSSFTLALTNFPPPCVSVISCQPACVFFSPEVIHCISSMIGSLVLGVSPVTRMILIGNAPEQRLDAENGVRLINPGVNVTSKPFTPSGLSFGK